MAERRVAVLDAGTTAVKALVFDDQLHVLHTESDYIDKSTPQPGWVEQDPAQIAEVSLRLLREAFAAYPQIESIGITNQRETFLLWDADGSALYPAIVWEDKRTEAEVEALRADSAVADYIRQTTGIAVSPYSSAPKLAWLLRHLKLDGGEGFGTVDSWLLKTLCGVHATDYTNASRTLLFNVHSLNWDERLLEIFSVPRSILPEVSPSRHDFGVSKEFGVPVRAVAGDQQASLYAAGERPGIVKITYGTGIFPMRLLGSRFELRDPYMTTLAVSEAGKLQYALEGKIEGSAAVVSPVYDAGED
ncbi:MAG: FGGY family carbohydrate kinase, partial [bacterium]